MSLSCQFAKTKAYSNTWIQRWEFERDRTNFKMVPHNVVWVVAIKRHEMCWFSMCWLWIAVFPDLIEYLLQVWKVLWSWVTTEKRTFLSAILKSANLQDNSLLAHNWAAQRKKYSEAIFVMPSRLFLWHSVSIFSLCCRVIGSQRTLYCNFELLKIPERIVHFSVMPKQKCCNLPDSWTMVVNGNIQWVEKLSVHSLWLFSFLLFYLIETNLEAPIANIL
jgi:hypothetical protein